MKQSKFLLMLFGASMTFFLTSCGGGDEKKSSETTTESTSNTTATTTEVTPVNTIVTAAQNMVLVRHKVANFAKWMVAYDGHDSARLADGLHSYVIGRDDPDSNMVTVALKADDL